MNNDNIKTLIEKSLRKLVERDAGLIHRKVKEECINHRFACYLEQFLNEESNVSSYNVDLEYNKNYNNPKKIIIDENNNVKSIRPDIIVHIRETNHNLIAFEIKKGYTDRHDLEKIKGLFRSPYNYEYGCLISYLPTKRYIKIKLLSNRGQKMEVFNLDKKG